MKRILMAGLPRAGKTSIKSVVFQNLSPTETLYLDDRQDPDVSFLDDITITHHPIDEPLDSEGGSCIFVIDSQDDYVDALQRLYKLVMSAQQGNWTIEIFIHKVDGLSDDHKIDTMREIHSRFADEFMDSQIPVVLSYYLTSIYDHSVFEAFSKVIQKRLNVLPTLENLLNMLCSVPIAYPELCRRKGVFV